MKTHRGVGVPAVRRAVHQRFAADFFMRYGSPVPVKDAIFGLAPKARTAFVLDVSGAMSWRALRTRGG